MADYQKMYALLCGALDDVIDPLEQIPLAIPYASVLRRALEDAEELYIETADRKFSCGGLWMIRFCDRIQGIPMFLRRPSWDLPLFYCLPIWP